LKSTLEKVTTSVEKAFKKLACLCYPSLFSLSGGDVHCPDGNRMSVFGGEKGQDLKNFP
jgi:hypothetical protein